MKNQNNPKQDRIKKSMTMEPVIETAIRKIQARLIEKNNESWSHSSVMNLILLAGFDAGKRMTKNDWQKLRNTMDQKSIKIDEKTISDIVKSI